MVLDTYLLRGVSPCPLHSGHCSKDRTVILAVVKAWIFLKTDFPFSPGSGQEGLMMHEDSVIGQRMTIKNSWDKRYWSGKGLGRSLSPTFYSCSHLLNVERFTWLFMCSYGTCLLYFPFFPFLLCLSLSQGQNWVYFLKFCLINPLEVLLFFLWGKLWENTL